MSFEGSKVTMYGAGDRAVWACLVRFNHKSAQTLLSVGALPTNHRATFVFARQLPNARRQCLREGGGFQSALKINLFTSNPLSR